MKNKNKLLLSLLFLLTLTGCKTPPSSSDPSSLDQSSKPSDVTPSSNESSASNESSTSELTPSSEGESSQEGTSNTLSSETNSNTSSTSEEGDEDLEPVDYPFVIGETNHSEAWPNESINGFINAMREGDTFPLITLDKTISHGVDTLGGELLYWLEVETNEKGDMTIISSALEAANYTVDDQDEDYFFIVTENYEIMVQVTFIEENEDKPSYLEVFIYVVPLIVVPEPTEIDNVFTYDFSTTDQLVSHTPTLGTWAEGDSEFIVDRNGKNSNHGVGGDAGLYLSKPLRVYEGQIVNINLSNDKNIELVIFEIATSDVVGLIEGYFDQEASYYVVNNFVTILLEEETSTLSFEAYTKVFFDSVQIYYI